MHNRHQERTFEVLMTLTGPILSFENEKVLEQVFFVTTILTEFTRTR